MGKLQLLSLLLAFSTLTFIFTPIVEPKVGDGTVYAGKNCLQYISNVFPVERYVTQDVLDKAESLDYYASVNNTGRPNAWLNPRDGFIGRLQYMDWERMEYHVIFFNCTTSDACEGDWQSAHLLVIVCDGYSLEDAKNMAVSEMKMLGIIKNDPAITFGAPMGLYSTASGGGYGVVPPAGIDPIFLLAIIAIIVVIAAALILRRFL